MIYERTEILKSFDNTDLFFRVFTPKKRERRIKTDGVILAVHGFGEHSGRFAELAEYVCTHNLALASFDIRGHGKSGVRKGDAENFASLINDVVFVIQHTRALFGINSLNEPFFGILGHSFGGLLALYASAILRDLCPPLLLTSPLFKLKDKVPMWKKLLASSMSKVTPIIQLPIDITGGGFLPANINADTDASDKQNLFSASPRLGDIFFEALADDKVRHAISLVQVPTTIVCGANDTFADTTRIQDLLINFATDQTALHTISNVGHELFHSPLNEHPEILDIIIPWIQNKGQIQ